MTKERARVLIVDDETDFAEALGFLLMNEGLAVDWAFDGDEALARMKIDNFDYIITDYKMPKVSGDELFEFAPSEMEEAPQFIFITGFPEAISEKIFKNKILAIFPKTVHYKQVVERITNDQESRFAKTG